MTVTNMVFSKLAFFHIFKPKGAYCNTVAIVAFVKNIAQKTPRYPEVNKNLSIKINYELRDKNPAESSGYRK